jgi:NAD+ kinase
MTPIKTIGLAPNPRKAEAVELTRRLADWLEEQHIRVLVIDEAATLIGRPQSAASDEKLVAADLLVVLGGDGTLLRWNRLAAPLGTPMIGINFGRYGFITEVAPDAAQAALTSVLEGRYTVSERVVLSASVSRGGQIAGTFLGLNDIVVSKGPLARILNWHTYINDKFIVTHAADGMIVATPTGSTAYSMSAGGPVIHPDVSVLTITPICPHTLSGRSLVVPDTERVKIVGEHGSESAEMMLTVDGQLGEHLVNGDVVEVCKADFKSKLVQVETDSFYTKLTTRLRWGERS